MRNKLLTILGVLVLASLVLVACQPSAEPAAPTEAPEPTAVPTEAPEPTEAPTEAPEPTEAPTEEPEVGLLVWADNTRAPIIEELGASFTEQYGVNLTVQLVDFGSIRDEMSVKAPAGEGPDIIIGAHDWLGELVISGLLAPIDLGDLADEFVPASIQAFNYEGVQYGLPYATENVALFYNPELVAEPPTTWSEVMAIATELEDAGTVEYGYVLQPNDTYHFFPIATAFGGYIFGLNDDGTYNAEDVGVDNEGTLAAAAWLDQMVKDGHLSADFDWDTIHSLFEQGQAAMVITGPWAVSRFDEAGISYEITNLPGEAEESRPFLGVQGFMINAFSENTLLAEIFLTEFVATEEAMAMIYEAGDRPSAHIGVLATLEDPALVAFGEAGANGLPMPAIPEMSAVWDSYNDAITIVFQQQQDANEAFLNAADQIRTAIAEGQ